MLFLTHGTAQQVSLSQREPSQHLHNLHNLLLIEHHTKRFFKDRFQQRVHIGNFLASMTAGDEVLHHAAAQGAWTVQSHCRNEVSKVPRCKVFHQGRHARRFHLEHSPRAALTEHFGRKFIFQGNLIDIHHFAPCTFDIIERITDNRERTQPQKVHFEQAKFLHMVFVKFRNQRTFRY